MTNLLFVLILFTQNNYVFGPSIRVNDDPPGTCSHIPGSSGFHSIAAHGDTVYLCWRDDRQAYPGIYFSRSTDNGNTWSPNLRITSSAAGLTSITPSLAVDDHRNIHICYCQIDENNSYNRDVYFTKSTDGGLSFSTPVIVNDTTRSAQDMPSIAVDTSGQKVFIAWEDARNIVSPPNLDIYVARSTDGGATFLPSVRVDDTGDDSLDQEMPSIGCTRSGDTVCVAWWDERNDIGDDNYDIYFSRSVDGGQTFEPNILVNDTTGGNNTTQWFPSLWMSKSGIVYLAWRDLTFGWYQILFAKSVDCGQTFTGHRRVTDTLQSAASYPSIYSLNDTLVYVVWKDNRTYNQTGSDIYFAFSSDCGSTFNANVRVNDTLVLVDADQWYPTLCVNEMGEVFVSWADGRYHSIYYDIYFASGAFIGITEHFSETRANALNHIFPSVLKNHIIVSNHHNEIDKIEIFDSAGRRVKHVDIFDTESVTLDVSELPCGIYFVQVLQQGMVSIQKVVKIK